MKVATILLAIAVASVSAMPEKQPTENPIHLQQQPAVVANAKASLHEAASSTQHGAQAVVDAGRELKQNLVDPSVHVANHTAKAAAEGTRGVVDRKVAQIHGAASAANYGLAETFRRASEWFLQSAASQSDKHDAWAGASADASARSHDHAEDAKAPINRGVENVKETASNAAETVKDKAAHLKDRTAEKADAAKEDVKDAAADAKDATKNAAAKSGNFFSRKFHAGVRGVGAATEKVGDVTEKVGEKIEEKGAALREHEQQKVEVAEQERVEIVEHSSAMSAAAPTAAFAIAAAAAAYMI